jgi:hypothetical protein
VAVSVDNVIAFSCGIKSPAKLLSTAFNALVFLSVGIFRKCQSLGLLLTE